MKISIIQGTREYLQDCKVALMKSQLGETYYANEEVVNSILKDGIDKGEIFLALDENKLCVGYLWFTLTGAFYGFPYLRSIAVKQEYRNQGIGNQLISYFENTSFSHRSKVFLLVSDFSYSARNLFERLGYEQVGSIPNLFKEGITEYIMIKTKLD